MAYGTVTIGRLSLREALSPGPEKTDATGMTALALTGQEASPPLSAAAVMAIQDDIRSLPGSFVPVTCVDKADLSGYYVVADSSAELMSWNGEVVTCAWAVSMQRVGSDAEVDVEARLAGPLTRSNQHSVVGERWHAPPIGHSAYWTGATTASTMTRTTTDGAITVYRGVPVLTSARYACPVESYTAGRVRFIDGGRERAGMAFEATPAGWQLHNGLVRVSVSAGTLSVASWTAGAWAAKGWDILLAGVGLGAPASATVLRNDPECVTIRLLWSLAPGRATCDITVRRGSRIAELYIQTSASTTIKVARTTTEAGTAGTGFLRATSNDGDGNRYLVGSTRTHTVDANGGISVASVTALDAFIGVELAGSSAVSGDTGTDVMKQYCGAPAETTRGARR